MLEKHITNICCENAPASKTPILLNMNIYARYFNQDTLVYSYEELMDFLSSIPEIPVNQRLADDVRAYIDSDMPYPRRYKIRPRVYFILIKTDAQTMDEFKANRKHVEESEEPQQRPMPAQNETQFSKKDIKNAQLANGREGWYFANIAFKRVIQIANTNKFRYQDTTFSAYVKAESGIDCYQRVVEHLKNRPEIDLRSQFPSARGSNFSFQYVGETLPTE